MSIFNEQCIGGEDHWMSSAFIWMYFLSTRPQQKQTTWKKSLAQPSKNSSSYDYMSFWYNKTYSSTIHLDFQLYISSSMIYSTQHILGGSDDLEPSHVWSVLLNLVCQCGRTMILPQRDAVLIGPGIHGPWSLSVKIMNSIFQLMKNIYFAL